MHLRRSPESPTRHEGIIYTTNSQSDRDRPIRLTPPASNQRSIENRAEGPSNTQSSTVANEEASMASGAIHTNAAQLLPESLTTNSHVEEIAKDAMRHFTRSTRRRVQDSFLHPPSDVNNSTAVKTAPLFNTDYSIAIADTAVPRQAPSTRAKKRKIVQSDDDLSHVDSQAAHSLC